MVISTGMTCPANCCVCSLYCRQKSMMLTPCCPRAVPTGGAGVAWPALIWSFTLARTFLRGRRSPSATSIHLLRSKRPLGLPLSSCRPARRLDLRHLVEAELDRGLPVEDVHQDLELALVHVDLADRPVEVRERPRDDTHGVALFELQAEGGLHLLLLHREDLLDLAAGEGRGLGPGARGHEPGHPRRVADHVPGVVVVDHLHQQVAGEDLALDHLLLPALDLHDVLHGDVD